MKYMKATCLIILFISLPINGLFSSLSRLSAYAEHVSEYPEIDNADWGHPDFTSFYRSQMPSFWSRIKSFFDLKKERFDLTLFSKTLQDVTIQRKEKGFLGEFVQKIPFKTQGRVIVFGDLQGAFHSLVRALRYLETQDILSEQMLVEEGTYIVFNGNAIDAAAYNLETLMVILILMQKNPERVIYISGQNEQNREKESSGLYRQLKEVAGDKADVLFSNVTDFFDTLPHAVYVMRGLSGALKIFSRTVSHFNDELLGSFLSSHDNNVILHAKDYGKSSSSVVPINVVIGAHDNTHTQGLKRYAGPPTTWTVFSSPTGAHRRLYGFFKDAFAIIDSAIHFHDWMITLYAADLQAGTGFASVGTYNLSTGVFISGKQIDFFDFLEMQRFEEMVKDKKKMLAELKENCNQSDKKIAGEQKISHKDVAKQVLLVGTSADVSKSAKNIGNKINETLTKAFEEKNKQGGVRGVTFQSIFLDDAYTPEIARKNFLKFVQDLRTDIVLAPFGTATTQEGLDLVKDDKIVILFPAITESRLFRNSHLKNIVSLSASYYEQGKALINYLIPKYNPQKIALFYQNDDFGKDGLAGAKEALQKFSGIQIVELPYERNQVNFSSQKKIIEEERPDAIGFFSLPLAAVTFMKSLGANFLSQKLLFGISDLRDSDLLQFMKSKGLLFTYANSLPNWQTRSMPLVQEYEHFVELNNIIPDPFSFEVYVIAQIFFYLIDRIEGPVTKEKIIQAAENIKNLDFKGLNLNFDSGSRVLLDAVWIAQNNEEPWVRVPINEERQGISRQDKSDSVGKVSPEKKIAENIEAEKGKVEDNADRVKAADEEPLLALHGDLLVLGNTSDMSKGLKVMSDEVHKGLEIGVNAINEKGGVRGLRFKIVYLDDEYVPELAHKNVEILLKDYKTNIAIGSVGTPTLESYIDLVKAGKVAVFFPFTGSSLFRTKEFSNLLHFSPSYNETSEAVTNYILKNSSPTRWALLYQDDSFGILPKNAVKKLLEKNNIKDILELSFSRNDVNFSEQVKSILDFKPGVIGIFGPAIAAQGFIRAAGAKDLSDKILYGLSWMAGDKMQTFLKEKGLKMIIPNTVPNPKISDIPIAKEFRKVVEGKGVSPDVNVFEGYLYIKLFAHLLKGVEGEITIEKIMRVAQSIKNVDFEGLMLNFTADSRQLSHHMWLDLGTGQEWIKIDLAAERAN